jgi:protein tyrosine phosphatase (PTP) superfamily phosphohydrolase (DUF442 family)
MRSSSLVEDAEACALRPVESLATPEAPPGASRWRKGRWRLFLAALVLAVVALWVVPAITDNFGTVIPGVAYRSSQLSPAALESHIAGCGLRSIINLRGSNTDSQWYWDERNVAVRHGVRHYDIGLDSHYPYPDELREVIETLETCPKPVVFHCFSGVDRTGTVAAIAVLLLDDAGTLDQAETHFGLRYLQFPWRTNAICQRQFFDLYRQWLARNDVPHSPAVFRRWALQYYERPPEEIPENLAALTPISARSDASAKR